MFTLFISIGISMLFAMIGGMSNSIIAWIISVTSAIIGVCITLFPIEGFKEKELVEEYSLLPLNCERKTDKQYYVVKVGNRAYFAYDISTEYDIQGYGTLYKEKRIKGKIKIYEKSGNLKPTLKVYKTKPIREYWAIAPFSTKKEYIFIIPSGTCDKANIEVMPEVV